MTSYPIEADYPRSIDVPAGRLNRSMTFGSRYTREITDPEALAEARVAVNQCWLDDPQWIIGQPVVVTSDHSLWLQVSPPAGDLAAALSAQMTALLPTNVITPHRSEAVVIDDPDVPAPLHERRAQQITIPVLSGVAQERAAGLARLYNAAKAIIRAELNDAPDVDAARSELNRVYEQFIFQYGVIHDPRNQKLFGDLPELQFLLALERNPRRTPSGRWRADRERIFRERTIHPHQPALPGTLNPTEALLRCLDERGGLDIAQYFMIEMRELDQEELWVACLDTKNRLIRVAKVYRGSVNTAMIRVCEIFKEAVRCNATAIVVAHNHPSCAPRSA